MTSDFQIVAFTDELGPVRVTHFWEPATGLRATLAVDNVACGPSMGGVRIAADVSTASGGRGDGARAGPRSGPAPAPHVTPPRSRRDRSDGGEPAGRTRVPQ